MSFWEWVGYAIGYELFVLLLSFVLLGAVSVIVALSDGLEQRKALRDALAGEGDDE